MKNQIMSICLVLTAHLSAHALEVKYSDSESVKIMQVQAARGPELLVGYGGNYNRVVFTFKNSNTRLEANEAIVDGHSIQTFSLLSSDGKTKMLTTSAGDFEKLKDVAQTLQKRSETCNGAFHIESFGGTYRIQKVDISCPEFAN